jgi:hypothetical protein
MTTTKTKSSTVDVLHTVLYRDSIGMITKLADVQQGTVELAVKDCYRKNYLAYGEDHDRGYKSFCEMLTRKLSTAKGKTIPNGNPLVLDPISMRASFFYFDSVLSKTLKEETSPSPLHV